MERQVRGDTRDLELRNRPPRPRQRRVPVGRMDNQLGEQRIEPRIGRHARLQRAVDADARPAGHLDIADGAARRTRHAVGTDRLGIDAQLDRDAARARPLRRNAAPFCEPKLQRHKVQPGHLLGHRMLHLKPRVHLEEGERLRIISSALLVDQELRRRQSDIAGVLQQAFRGTLDPAGKRCVDRLSRRDLDQFLVPPLHRAVARAQRDNPAVRIGRQLNLYMPRRGDVTLNHHFGRSERRQRFGARGLDLRRKRRAILDHADPAPATASQRLHHHRPAYVRPLGQHRHAHRPRVTLGDVLVAEQRQQPRRRADEQQPGLGTSLGKGRILAEEAVAGMNRAAACLARRGDHCINGKVGGRTFAAQPDRAVSGAHMRRARVVGGMNRDRLDTQSGGGPRNTDRDLAAVSDQQAFYLASPFQPSFTSSCRSINLFSPPLS